MVAAAKMLTAAAAPAAAKWLMPVMSVEWCWYGAVSGGAGGPPVLVAGWVNIVVARRGWPATAVVVGCRVKVEQ